MLELRPTIAMGFASAICWWGCAHRSDPAPAPADATHTSPPAAMAEHVHGAGPNGGVVFDLGSHHAEFTVDHGKRECAILLLGDDERTPAAVDAAELILITQATRTAEGTVVSPLTITLAPVNAIEGKSATFVGTDPGLGRVADFAGMVSGVIDGKPSEGEFKE